MAYDKDEIGGRPTKYDESYNEIAYKLTLLGHTDAELAIFFEVTEQTINNWKRKHPKFFESIKKGKDIADVDVVMALRKRALGYSYEEIKVEVSQDDNVSMEDIINGDGDLPSYVTKKTVTLKEVIPDVGAQMSWLHNRQPKSWKRNRDTQDQQDTKPIKVVIENKTHNLDE